MRVKFTTLVSTYSSLDKSLPGLIDEAGPSIKEKLASVHMKYHEKDNEGSEVNFRVECSLLN